MPTAYRRARQAGLLSNLLALALLTLPLPTHAVSDGKLSDAKARSAVAASRD